MNLANKLTMLRFVMVPVFIIATYLERGSSYTISTLIFILAAATDFFDGYIARKYKMITDFGKFMDPLADKVLVAAALLTLVQTGRAEAWLVLIIITREYAISILRSIAATKGTVIAASQGGKVKTVTQMVAIVMLLLNLPFANIIFYLSVAATLYSGYDYIAKNKALLRNR